MRDDMTAGHKVLIPALCLCVAAAILLLGVPPGWTRTSAEGIRLTHPEGDVAGFTAIYAADGAQPIGFVEYRQVRRGDTLSMTRIAHFRDGSSDEDTAEAHVAGALDATRGRSIIRDANGAASVDLTIDVTGQRIRGSWGTGAERKTIDEHRDLSPRTYWGPLIFIVLKNFEANAADGRVAFETVAPTPQPRVLELELVRGESTRLQRTGAALDVVRYDLRPTVHWAIDPFIRAIAPDTHFLVRQGDPPALARFAGPRNYAGQEIRIE